MDSVSVLDKGFVELVDHLGDDRMVVNAARVSFAKETAVFGEKDAKLIEYLAKNKHISPFYHPQLQFRVKAPISVQRQWEKHKIGTAMNSESTRYVEVHDEFYVPDVMRAQSQSNKQGSAGTLEGKVDPMVFYHGRPSTATFEPMDLQEAARRTYMQSCAIAFSDYSVLIRAGVAKEQAREILPLCTYTSWIWTASLAAVAHFIRLRDHDHAQFEIREYARALRKLTEPIFPVSLSALERHSA